MSRRLFGTGFLLDVRRLFVRRISANLPSLLLENLLQPAGVACVVLFAFVNRADPEDLRETLVYFSTLFAFWIGMFGSCQSINAELRNGEWSYWVLGLGRNRYVHLAAIGTVNFAFALAQLAAFLLTIWLFRFLSGVGTLGIGSIYANFMEMFLSASGECPGSPLFQMQGLLKPILASGFAGAEELFVFALFGFALLAAAVSGIGFGLLFSATFRDPAVSLNVSVGFVVVTGMLSYVGLKGAGTEAERETNFLCERMAPVALAATRPPGAATELRAGSGAALRALASVASVLPQRYFYNLGTLTFERTLPVYEVDGARYNDLGTFVAATRDAARPMPAWLRYAAENRSRRLGANDVRLELTAFADPGLVRELAASDDFDADWEAKLADAFRRARATDPDCFARLDCAFVRRAYRLALGGEARRILWIFLVCIGLTALQLHRKEAFHVLR